jgi:hypothetical protein
MEQVDEMFNHHQMGLFQEPASTTANFSRAFDPARHFQRIKPPLSPFAKGG